MAGMDRRALFTSGAAAAVLAATGVSLQVAPRRGGRLRLALPRRRGRFDLVVHGAVFDTLTEVGPDGLLRGGLALTWDSESSARDWRFDLRRDMRFHDGRPFTAADAAWSLCALHGLTAEPLDAHSLRLTLPTSDPHLPYDLADPAHVILPEGAALADLVGTGPYRSERYRPGRHFLGRRVAAQGGDGGWFDSVEVAVIPDATVRAEAVRDGYVDVADLPEPTLLRQAAGIVTLPDADTCALAARAAVAVPPRMGMRAPLDDGRITRRWWMA